MKKILTKIRSYDKIYNRGNIKSGLKIITERIAAWEEENM